MNEKSHKLWLSQQASDDLKKKPESKPEPEPEAKPVNELQKQRLADKRRRDEIHSRERAQRKALFQAAKDSDKELGIVCTKYYAAEALELDDRRKMQHMKVKVHDLKKEAEDLDSKIKLLKEKWRKKREAYGKAKTDMNDFSIKLTITARMKRGVQEAWTRCEEAWSKISRTFVKKHRDRSVRKQAKEILKVDK